MVYPKFGKLSFYFPLVLEVGNSLPTSFSPNFPNNIPLIEKNMLSGNHNRGSRKTLERSKFCKGIRYGNHLKNNEGKKRWIHKHQDISKNYINVGNNKSFSSLEKGKDKVGQEGE